jgi:hypothetical protein
MHRFRENVRKWSFLLLGISWVIVSQVMPVFGTSTRRVNEDLMSNDVNMPQTRHFVTDDSISPLNSIARETRRSVTVHNKFFDPTDDEFRVEDSICLGDTMDIRFSVNPEEQFFIAYLDHSIVEPVQMTAHVGSKVYSIERFGGIRPADDESPKEEEVEEDVDLQFVQEETQVQYILIKPSMLAEACFREAENLENQIGDPSCNITISLKAVPLEGNSFQFHHSAGVDNRTCGEAKFVLTAVLGKILKFSQPQRDAAKMLRVKRFGLEITEKDLNVLVEMTPEPRFAEMDLDLFLYHESDLFSFIFPNSDLINRNHHWNVPEYMFLSRWSLPGKSQPKFEPGFYLAYVYAPVDSGHELNLFEIVVHKQCKEHQVRPCFLN